MDDKIDIPLLLYSATADLAAMLGGMIEQYLESARAAAAGIGDREPDYHLAARLKLKAEGLEEALELLDEVIDGMENFLPNAEDYWSNTEPGRDDFYGEIIDVH